MDFQKKAARYFHGEEKYNCAQATLKILEHYPGVTSQMIDEFRAWGGGRAHGGLCGALFSALTLADSALHDNIRKEFAAAAGALKCRDIKDGAKLSCIQCVAAICEIFERNTAADNLLPADSRLGKNSRRLKKSPPTEI